MSSFWPLLSGVNIIGVGLAIAWWHERKSTMPFYLALTLPVWLVDVLLLGSLL